MINWDKISAWWRELNRRRRLSLTSSRDGVEVWYTHISPLNLFMALFATVALIFVCVISLLSYTPLLDYLPGHRIENHEARERVIESIIRIDSMERVISNMMLYSDNVSLIMAGKTPVVEEMLSRDSIVVSKIDVQRNSADSMLRAEMVGDGRYNTQNALLSGVELMVIPVEGVITRHFNIAERSYGVEISTSEGGRVMAAQSGIVLFSSWTADSDYVVHIMHPNNKLTIYRNMKNVAVERGDSVEAGSVIGYNSNHRGSSSLERGVVGFEIWIDGKPIDPEKYIVF